METENMGGETRQGVGQSVLTKDEVARLDAMPPGQFCWHAVETRLGIAPWRVVDAAVADELPKRLNEEVLLHWGAEPIRLAQERRAARMAAEHGERIEKLLAGILDRLVVITEVLKEIGTEPVVAQPLASTYPVRTGSTRTKK